MARFRLPQRRIQESPLCYNADMSETLPPDVQQFVRDAIATGEYATEEEVLTQAVRVLREVSERR